MKQIISKAYFGKNNCLKVYLNNKQEFYFEFGLNQKEKWTWKKVKMNDDEIADIINVLEFKKNSTSFFHDFKGDKTQIWISRKESSFFIKVKELTKSLNESEQTNLREILKYCIIRMNLNL